MTTYYLAKTGSDSNNGLSLAAPFLTLAHAAAAMSSGDQLLIRAGTWTEDDIILPSGSSWAAATTVQNYNGETVIFRPGSNSTFDLGRSAPHSYIIFDGTDVDNRGLIFDGSDIHVDALIGMNQGSHHIRHIRCEIRNAPLNGFQFAWGNNNGLSSDFNEILYCEIHHCGSYRYVTLASGAAGVDYDQFIGFGEGTGHAIYCTTSFNTIDHNVIHHNGEYAVHQYSFDHPMSANLVSFNVCYENNQDTSRYGHRNGGAIIVTGVGSVALRNVCYLNDNGIDVGAGYGGAVNCKVLFNTLYSNNGDGDGHALQVNPSASGTLVIGNLIRGTHDGGDIVNLGSSSLIQNNWLSSDADPKFVDAGGGDFHLESDSPCINAAPITNSVAYTGAAPDFGAYEFGGEDLPIVDVTITPNPIPPGGSGTVDYDSDGDSVDIPGVGTGLPPSGSFVITPSIAQTLTIIAYNVNGSVQVEHAVGVFSSGLLYKAAIGYMPRSIKAGADLSVDNMEIVGLMPNKVKALAQGLLLEGLSDEDLDVGRFDHARIELFYVNHQDPAAGRIILPGSGNIGEIKLRRGTHETEFRGLTIFLQQTFGDVYSKICRARLGDDINDYRIAGFGCHVRLDPPFWRPETSYTVRQPYDAATGSVIKPNIYNGRHFVCVTAGISLSIEPTWNFQIDGLTNDGVVVWKTVQALTVFGAVTAVKDTRFFSDASRSEPPTSGTGVNSGTAQYAIRDANVAGGYFELDGDLVSYFLIGNTFTVTGSIANDASYTVTNALLSSGNTRIFVGSIPDTRAGGFITAPFAVATGFFTFGKLTFLTGANIGISKEVKDFRLSVYALIDVDSGTNLFVLDGDQSDFFSVGQRFAVAGSTGNDGAYDISAVSYNSGADQTEITVSQTIADDTVDGSVLAGPGEFEMFERFPFTIEVGDEYMVQAGCDLSKEICKAKFDNIYNRRAEDEIPGTDVALLFPDRQV